MFVAWSLCAKDGRKHKPAVCQSMLSWDLCSVSAVTMSPYICIDATSDVQQQMVNNSLLQVHFWLCWCQCFSSINHWGIFQQEYCSSCCSGTTCSMHYFLGLNAIYEAFTFSLSSGNILSGLLCKYCSLFIHISSSWKGLLVSVGVS